LAARVDLDDAVYGVHAIEEALAAGETLRRIHVAGERRREHVDRVARRRDERRVSTGNRRRVSWAA